MDLLIEFIVWLVRALAGGRGESTRQPLDAAPDSTSAPADTPQRGPYNYGDGRGRAKTLEEILEEVRQQRQAAPGSARPAAVARKPAASKPPPQTVKAFPAQGESGTAEPEREAFHNRPKEVAKRGEEFAAQGQEVSKRREEFADHTGAAQAAQRAAERRVQAPKNARAPRVAMEQPGELSSVGERPLSSLEGRTLTTRLKQEEIVKPKEIERRFTELDRREDSKFKPSTADVPAEQVAQTVAGGYLNLFNALRTAPRETRIEMARRAFVFNIVFGPCKAKTKPTSHTKTKSVTQSRAEQINSPAKQDVAV